MIMEDDSMSLHILNYNSPGATGALPLSVHLINRLHERGFFRREKDDCDCGPWKFSDLIEKIST